MKQKILTLAAGLLCLGNMAMASMAPGEDSLGGLSLGNHRDYVTQIYGEPDKTTGVFEQRYGPRYGEKVQYGDSVVMLFTSFYDKEGPFILSYIHISANNGFSTPKGIHVGSTKNEVYRAYGKPDLTQKGKDNLVLWSYKVKDSSPVGFVFEGNILKYINHGSNC